MMTTSAFNVSTQPEKHSTLLFNCIYVSISPRALLHLHSSNKFRDTQLLQHSPAYLLAAWCASSHRRRLRFSGGARGVLSELQENRGDKSKGFFSHVRLATMNIVSAQFCALGYAWHRTQALALGCDDGCLRVRSPKAQACYESVTNCSTRGVPTRRFHRLNVP